VVKIRVGRIKERTWKDGNPGQWRVRRAVEIEAIVFAMRKKTQSGPPVQLHILLEFLRFVRESDDSLPIPIFGVPNDQQSNTQSSHPEDSNGNEFGD
jgi:hypothetical protein